MEVGSDGRRKNESGNWPEKNSFGFSGSCSWDLVILCSIRCCIQRSRLKLEVVDWLSQCLTAISHNVDQPQTLMKA